MPPGDHPTAEKEIKGPTEPDETDEAEVTVTVRPPTKEVEQEAKQVEVAAEEDEEDEKDDEMAMRLTAEALPQRQSIISSLTRHVLRCRLLADAAE